jgi:hypothetical protein
MKTPDPPANLTRRRFLRASVIGGLAGMIGVRPSFGQITGTAGHRHAPTLAEAYRLIDFNPEAGDSFTVAWAADLHYGIGNPEALLPPVTSELAAMNPRPEFIGLIGDLADSASTSFGSIPTPAQRVKTVEELRAFRKHYEDLARLAPVKLSLGNHDTFPGDENQLFGEVFPGEPVTHAFAVKGVPFIILNGGSCGFLGDAQQAWFRSQVQKWHHPGGSLIVAVHQPSLGMMARERGIAVGVRDALGEARGNLWLLGGHEHKNEDARFSIPKGDLITQARITSGNPLLGKEVPGYWIWCFRNGQVAGRIFRRLGDPAGFAISPDVKDIPPKPLPLPFEDREKVLWKVMVGEGDEPYRVTTKANWCLNYWAHVQQLEYRFPLKQTERRARRCTVVLSPMETKDHPMTLSTSSDGKDWRVVSDAVREGEYATLPIPADCLTAGTLALRLENCAVSGFALTE